MDAKTLLKVKEQGDLKGQLGKERDEMNHSLIPSINMVTKHSNGTLNQWQVSE